jgi:hypothetical protein
MQRLHGASSILYQTRAKSQSLFSNFSPIQIISKKVTSYSTQTKVASSILCHVTEALGPSPNRAPVSPCVMWLQTRLLVREGSGAATCPVALGPRACPGVPKMPDIRLIIASVGTRCRQHIKCVYDRPYVAYGMH